MSILKAMAKGFDEKRLICDNRQGIKDSQWSFSTKGAKNRKF